jgi:hypothetical protein
MAYKVLDREFDYFVDVVDWAWCEHKIDFEMDEIEMSVAEKQEACIALEEMLRDQN